MAAIFLSYARADAAKAKRIAEALEKAGHSVWWDRQLHAGSRFSAEIDKALKAADAVVVLWSRASVESAWVQDEAAAGRDSGRLIPVLIGKVEPPLGFRQYHSIILGSRTLGAAALEPLLSAVDQRLSSKADREVRPARASARPMALGAAGVIVLVLLALAWWRFEPIGGSGQPSIIIEPSSQSGSPAAAIVAPAIAAALGRFQAGPLAPLQVEPAGSRVAVRYRAYVGMTEDERQLTLTVSLNSRSGQRLWSTTLSGPSNGQSDLTRQAAAKLGAALACDLQAQAPHVSLPAGVRESYLDGCSRIVGLEQSRDDQAIDALRQVTQKAPRFAPGWAQLSLAEFLAINSAPPNEASNMAWAAGRHSLVASKLDASLPEPYLVQAMDAPSGPDRMADALSAIDRGLARNRESALLNDARATVLGNVGRLREALESARRAHALNPLSTGVLRNYVMLLTYTGEMAAARDALKDAEATWPRSRAVADVRFEFESRYGDPGKALQMISDGFVEQPDEGYMLYLHARLQPTSANIEALLRYYRLRFEKDPSNVFGYLQALGTFNRVDEAFRVLAGPQLIDGFYYNGEALFRPFIKPIRADPRFIGIAYRAGMLTFWRKSNAWADFCSDPQLPYDCRKEAAKYPLALPAS